MEWLQKGTGGLPLWSAFVCEELGVVDYKCIVKNKI
jgi:hypothetical protein